jgi:hypothetical protein
VRLVRISLAVVALLAVPALLAGCGSSSSPQTATSTTAPNGQSHPKFQLGRLVDFSKCMKGRVLKLSEENRAAYRAEPSANAEMRFGESLGVCSSNLLVHHQPAVEAEWEGRCGRWEGEREAFESALAGSNLSTDDQELLSFELREICPV